MQHIFLLSCFSGGWSVVLCPHGIVYSLKFNIRAESPRDFADLLLSWQHFPNICIYDFARGLATHTNLREPTVVPFRPNEGRLAASTTANIEAAQQQKLKVSLPWLHQKATNPENDGHPVTGFSGHFALYDKFHEGNTKSQEEVLRRIELVPELQGTLNSQVAEQLFANMRKNNYYLNNMAPSTHIFLLRNIIHHQNNRCNEKFLEKQLKRGGRDVTFKISLDDLGRAVFAEGTPSLCGNALVQPCAKVQTTCTDVHSDTCGPQCEQQFDWRGVLPSRASWSLQRHPAQVELLNYVLDEERPRNELIVRTNQACLTREDFLTLGFDREMESTIGNACFEIIEKIAQEKGKKVFVADLYVVPTWRQPIGCDPLLTLPVNI